MYEVRIFYLRRKKLVADSLFMVYKSAQGIILYPSSEQLWGDVFVHPVVWILRLSTEWRHPLSIHSFSKPCRGVIQSFTVRYLTDTAFWIAVIPFSPNLCSYFPSITCAFYSFNSSLVLRIWYFKLNKNYSILTK